MLFNAFLLSQFLICTIVGVAVWYSIQYCQRNMSDCPHEHFEGLFILVKAISVKLL